MIFLFIFANLIASFIFLLLVGLFIHNTEIQRYNLSRTLLFIAFVIGASLQSLAFSASTVIAWNALLGNSVTLWEALRTTFKKWFHVITAGLLLSTAIAIGVAFFLLPGLLISFIFMFTFVFIMINNQTAIDAMKESFIMVKQDITGTLKLFFGIVTLSVVAFIIGRIFIISPFLGQLIVTLVLSTLFSYTATAIVTYYYQKKISTDLENSYQSSF